MDKCDGSGSCKASPHVHGCYADRGDCEAPQEHVEPADPLYNLAAKQTDAEYLARLQEIIYKDVPNQSAGAQ